MPLVPLRWRFQLIFQGEPVPPWSVLWLRQGKHFLSGAWEPLVHFSGITLTVWVSEMPALFSMPWNFFMDALQKWTFLQMYCSPKALLSGTDFVKSVGATGREFHHSVPSFHHSVFHVSLLGPWEAHSTLASQGGATNLKPWEATSAPPRLFKHSFMLFNKGELLGKFTLLATKIIYWYWSWCVSSYAYYGSYGTPEEQNINIVHFP